jgi:hypothetical protein
LPLRQRFPRRSESAFYGDHDSIVSIVPRHGGHLDVDVRILGHEILGEGAKLLALGAHRPHRERDGESLADKAREVGASPSTTEL